MTIAHKAQRPILKNVPYTIDADTYALWTFNDSLDSMINIIPAIDIDSYEEDINITGKHGGGVQVSTVAPLPIKYLKYEIPANISTISFWFKSNSNKETVFPETPRVLASQTSLDENGVEIAPLKYWKCYISSTGDMRVPIKNCVTLMVNDVYVCQVNKDIVDGQWHHVTIELNTIPLTGISGYTARLWVDGLYSEVANSGAGYISPIDFYTCLRLGHQWEIEGAVTLSDCTYDDLCIKTGYYTGDDIYEWYMSNAEPYIPSSYSIATRDGYEWMPSGAFTYDDMKNKTYLKLFTITYDRLEGK